MQLANVRTKNCRFKIHGL